MVLLSTAYFPPIEYLFHFIMNENVWIEAHENFVKQTYRNRCHIASANGLLALSIPLLHEGNKTLVSEKKISYAEPWQGKHWRAVESAYSSSPYFEYFETEIRDVIFSEHEKLIDLTSASLRVMLSILRIKKELLFTEEYFHPSPELVDLRNSIHPRQESKLNFPDYYQVFKEKNGFIANLSSLDLIFNEGLKCVDYLQSIRG